ncbi:MAG: M64 family metallopeptidase [Planctomycetota bacterium]
MRLGVLTALLAAVAATAHARPFRFAGREGTVTRIQEAADPARAISFVFVTDGYSASRRERKRLAGDLEDALALFREVEPFRSYRGLFRIEVVDLPAADDDASELGVTIPHPEPRNLMLFDVERLGALLAAAGVEGAQVRHVLHDATRFGGTAHAGEGLSITSRNAGRLNRELHFRLLPTLAHELGHAIAGLVEERAGAAGEERLREAAAGALPNAMTLGATPPWAGWLPPEPRVHAPDADAAFARRFDPDDAPVGFYGGAGSLPEGGYRAQAHCLMRSDAHRFCVACRQALVVAFHRLARPLRLVATPGDGALRLEARTGVPAFRLRWEVEGADRELAARVALTNAAQTSFLVVPADARVRCTLEDTTPFVRGEVPTAVASWPPTRDVAGLTAALAPACAQGTPTACALPAAPPAPEVSAPLSRR